MPATTDATGRSVHIAGFLNRLDGGLPEWDPGGVVLTRVDATHWRVTLTGNEYTQIEYKYALGDWEYVEKDAALRRDRQPPADAGVRRERHADGERHRPELAQRRALRELGGDAGRRARRNRPAYRLPPERRARERLPARHLVGARGAGAALLAARRP